MERHAAFPDRDDFRRMGKIIDRIIEKNLSQATTDDHSQYAVEQHVVDVLLFPAGGGDMRLLDANPAHPDELDEGQQVHQAVPTYMQRTKGEGNRIGRSMNDHVLFLSQ